MALIHGSRASIQDQAEIVRRSDPLVWSSGYLNDLKEQLSTRYIDMPINEVLHEFIADTPPVPMLRNPHITSFIKLTEFVDYLSLVRTRLYYRTFYFIISNFKNAITCFSEEFSDFVKKAVQQFELSLAITQISHDKDFSPRFNELTRMFATDQVVVLIDAIFANDKYAFLRCDEDAQVISAANFYKVSTVLVISTPQMREFQTSQYIGRPVPFSCFTSLLTEENTIYLAEGK